MGGRYGSLIKVGVLASGRGSNLQALIRWQRARMLGATIELVICNHRGAAALQLARSAGIDAEVCEYDRKDDVERRAAQCRMSQLFEERGIELIVLAGYDRVLLPEFVRRWEGRIINVHPSLLPAFAGGLHAQADALRYGVKVTGCTVHLVTEDVDGGPVISQAAVPVFPEDTQETLSARIREQEHRLLPMAVRDFAERRLSVEGRRVTVIGELSERDR